jgi:hypothetical protein
MPRFSSSRTRRRRARAGSLSPSPGSTHWLERLAAQRIEHEPIETYSNGVGHVKVPDPDGNALALAEQPDALLPASA